MILKQRAPRFYIRYFPSSIERRCNYLSGSVLKGRNDPWKIYRFINNIQQHRSIIEHGVQIFEKKRYKKKEKNSKQEVTRVCAKIRYRLIHGLHIELPWKMEKTWGTRGKKPIFTSRPRNICKIKLNSETVFSSDFEPGNLSNIYSTGFSKLSLPSPLPNKRKISLVK